jgi:transcriptional regulator
MTEYQLAVLEARERGLQHKQIARALGTTPDGVRSTLRKLEARGLPITPIQWPVPRP